MAACEKCWSDAYMRTMSDPSKSQSEHYHDLLEERKDNPCVQEPKVEDQNEKAIQAIKKYIHYPEYAGIRHALLDCIKKIEKSEPEEQLKERQEYQPDIHQIVIASNVIRFLNQYIHGIAEDSAIIAAMTEYASLRENKAIQEAIKCFDPLFSIDPKDPSNHVRIVEKLRDCYKQLTELKKPSL